MDKQIAEVIQKARYRVCIKDAWFGAISLHLEFVEANEESEPAVSTAATDGVSIYYNPDFIRKIHNENENFTVGVVLHEVLHCAYNHHTRRGNRDPKLWNIACDYRINYDLLETGYQLPPGHLYNKEYAEMSAEEIYEILKQSNPSAALNEGASNNKGQEFPGDIGGVLDAAQPGENEKFEESARKWRSIVNQANAVAKAAQVGKMPGHIRRLIEQYGKPKIDWVALLRTFIDESQVKDFSWLRPNRRYLSQGWYVPGFVADRLNHLLIYVDISGSVNDKLLGQFGGELDSALNEGVADKMTVAYADTSVRNVEEYYAGDKLVLKAIGCGGTDFRASFRHAMRLNEKDPVSAIIYFTDMQPISFGEDPGVPVLWAAYASKKLVKQLEEVVPFGEIIHVDVPTY